MLIRFNLEHRPGLNAGFSLIEVVMGVGVLGVVVCSLYAGLSSGFTLIQFNRENLRATQILEEKMEVVRLFNWDQVVNQPGFIPTSFTESFYPAGGTNASGLTYTGSVLLTNAPVSESYSNDLRLVRITVAWTSSGVQHQRQMSTFVTQYGMQRYIY